MGAQALAADGVWKVLGKSDIVRKSVRGETAPPNFRGPYDQRQELRPDPRAMPSRESREVADIHQRLDAITQQIERISKPAPRQDVSREQGVARVFTPKDFGLTDIMGQVVDVIRSANDLE